MNIHEDENRRIHRIEPIEETEPAKVEPAPEIDRELEEVGAP